MATQASGSATLRFGDTMVLAAVTVSQNVSTLPFFPLTVEYREKTYAAGKIPGGFLKREGRPSDKEILASRLIDRSIRPFLGTLERSSGRGSGRSGRGQLDPEPDVPAAGVFQRGSGRQRISRFDRH